MRHLLSFVYDGTSGKCVAGGSVVVVVLLLNLLMEVGMYICTGVHNDVYMYKHVYGEFTKDEKEKTQYQDPICSKADLEEGHGYRA